MARTLMKYWDKRAVLPPTDMPYRVHTRGRMRNTPQHATMGTYNQDCMITLFIAGQGHYLRQGRDISISAGMVGLVLPQDDAGLLMSDRHDPYDHFFCRFAGDMALAVAQRIINENGGQSWAFFEFEHWRDLLEVMLRLMSSHVDEQVFSDRLRPCDAVLVQALSMLDCRESASSEQISQDSVDHFIGEHLSTPLDISVMANHFGVTREYLCRKVKSVTGRTPLDLWRDSKIEWARNMLRHTNMQVQEISWRLGFKDQYYFSKVFHKCTGQSPTSVRKGAVPE